MRKIMTRYYPYILSLIGTCVSLILSLKYGEPKLTDVRQFLSMIVDISAIAVGFLGATMSIMLTIEDSRAIKQHKQAGTYREVINCLSSACTYCFLLAGLSLFLVFLEMSHPLTGNTSIAIRSLWIGLFVLSGFSYFWVIRIFSKILQRAATE